jgi:hypothetical protein
MTDLHDAVTSADVRNFELAITTKAFNVFFYKTDHALEDVLGPNYFDGVIEAMPRQNDRIEVVANSGGVADHATLAVSKIVNTSTHRQVEVCLLQKYRR